MQQLRRYLTKWPDVDDHLESMWNALEDGGFTLPSNPDTTSSTFASSTQRYPPLLQTPGASSSSQGNQNAGSSQSTIATQATSHYAWWHTYMPERNYKVQPDVTQDDFRRIFPSPPPAIRKRKKPPTSMDDNSMRSNKRAQPILELGKIHFVPTAIQQPWPTGCDTTIHLGTPIPHRSSHLSLPVPTRPQQLDLPVRYPAATMYRNLCELRVQTRHTSGQPSF